VWLFVYWPVASSIAETMSLGQPAVTGHAAETVDRETAESRLLLERAKAGDQVAFGRLVDLHQRTVYRTALAALGSHEDAEDAAQEAFIQAWRHLPGFRGDAAFRTWLLTIVWRKALDRRRSRLLWWTRRAVAPDGEDVFADLATSSPSPERAALASDEARRVRLEIDKLSAKLRDTLLLVSSGEHTYEEVAAILRAPVGTVKWRVAEARRIIARRMDACRNSM
jgi:RNA polymerase sigma-70 factor (ECF subfamily)